MRLEFWHNIDFKFKFKFKRSLVDFAYDMMQDSSWNLGVLLFYSKKGLLPRFLMIREICENEKSKIYRQMAMISTVNHHEGKIKKSK